MRVDVGVDRHAVDAAARGRGTDLEQVGVVRPVLCEQFPQHASDVRVDDRDGVPDVLLPDEVERRGRAVHRDLGSAQRREPEGVVVPPVAVAPDPEQALVEQAHHGCRHRRRVQAVAVEVGGDLSAEDGQRRGEDRQVRELVAGGAEHGFRGIPVLRASAAVDAGGLQRCDRVEARPDVGPSRRHPQRGEPGAVGGRHRPAIEVHPRGVRRGEPVESRRPGHMPGGAGGGEGGRHVAIVARLGDGFVAAGGPRARPDRGSWPWGSQVVCRAPFLPSGQGASGPPIRLMGEPA